MIRRFSLTMAAAIAISLGVSNNASAGWRHCGWQFGGFGGWGHHGCQSCSNSCGCGEESSPCSSCASCGCGDATTDSGSHQANYEPQSAPEAPQMSSQGGYDRDRNDSDQSSDRTDRESNKDSQPSSDSGKASLDHDQKSSSSEKQLP